MSGIGRFFMKDKAVKNLMAFIFCVTFCVLIIIVVVTTKATIDQLKELIIPLITAFFGYLAGTYSSRGERN
jgi:hypothetical protein